MVSNKLHMEALKALSSATDANTRLSAELTTAKAEVERLKVEIERLKAELEAAKASKEEEGNVNEDDEREPMPVLRAEHMFGLI